MQIELPIQEPTTTVNDEPLCPSSADHGAMVRRNPGSPEQAFCVEDGGQWWDCQSPHCTSSVLEPGASLRKFLGRAP